MSGPGSVRSGDADIRARIYEAALIPELWSSVLAEISEEIGAFGGGVISMDLERPSLSRFIASGEVENLLSRFFSEGWCEQNARMDAGIRNGVAFQPRFITEEDIFRPSDRYLETPMYRDFLIGIDAGRSAGTVVRHVDGVVAVFSFERRMEDGPLAPEARALLDRCRAHLARASVLAERLAFERAAASVETLGALGIPGVVLGRNCRIVAANHLLQARSDIVIGAADRFALKDGSADGLLSVALEGVLARAKVGTIPLRDEAGMLRTIANVIPLERSARDIFSRGSALVVLVDRAPSESDLGAPLMALFDLTVAEAAVAADIARGLTVAEIADRRQRSRETIRSQVKSILHKTGCARQSEMATLIARLHGPLRP